jgi:predicted transcriptional regulator
MSEIDSLLAKFIEYHLDDHFGTDMKQTIKSRLFERYGISLTEALKQYEPFVRTLREFFGRATDKMVTQLFEKVFVIRNSGKITSLQINDKKFAELLLESYGDKEKKMILMAVSSSALSISKILKQADISSQTTGYRIINNLIEDGLLVESGFDLSLDGKKRQAYRTPIKKINIAVDKESKLDVTLEFSEDLIKKSGILATLFTKKQHDSTY